MLSDATLQEFHQLALTIAPELGSQELYVLSHPPQLPQPRGCHGYCCKGCVLLRQHLQSVGAWQGPGLAIVFSDPDMTEEGALGTLLHEISHLLPAVAPIGDDELDVMDVEAEMAQMTQWSLDPAAHDPALPLWYPHHDKNFHRISLHLWWRAAMEGYVAPLDGLCAGLTYDMHPCYLYWRSIGNEGVTMRHLTFAEILKVDPPDRFDQLWRHDVARWVKHNGEVHTVMKEVA